MVFGRSKGDAMRETFAGDQPFIAGETVTGGKFCCTECDCELELEAGKVRNLPVCPACQNDRWRRP